MPISVFFSRFSLADCSFYRKLSNDTAYRLELAPNSTDYCADLSLTGQKEGELKN